MADNAKMNGLEVEIKASTDKAVKGIDGIKKSAKQGAKDVKKFGDAMQDAAKKAKDFSDAVAESGTTARQSETGINNTSTAVSKFAKKISSIKTKVSEAFSSKSLDSFSKKLDAASQKTSEFGSSIMRAKSMWTSLANGSSKVFEPIKNIGATVLQPIVGAMRTIGTIGVDSFNSIVKGIEKGVTTGNVFRGVLTGVTGVFGTLLKAATSVATTIGKVLVGSFVRLAGIAKNVLKSIVQLPSKIKESVTNAVENLRDKIAQVGKAAKDWFDKSFIMRPLRQAADSAAEFAKKLSHVGSSMKRVLFYRAIRTLIKEIGDAFKYGINNLYAWSNTFGGEFARSMDSISTSFAYFKNSVGAAVAPLINALAPAIDFVIDKAVALLNVINQLFARLSGASYWTRATKQATAYGDAAGGAGAAAKEAMRYLAPFDELNVLPSDSGSGGGGGGGGSSGGGGLFEEMVEFNDEIKDFADSLKAAFEAGDWKGVGDVISEKLNEIIEQRIDWPGLGQKFGYWVNAIVSMEYWTLEQTHFDSLGKGIADFINNAIDQIDFETWGRLITRKVTAALDFAGGLFGELDTSNIGDAIHDYFIGLFDEWSEWFDQYDWADLGHVAYEKLTSLFDGLNYDDIAGHAMTALGKAFGSAAKFASTFFGDLGADIKTWFDNNLKGQSWQETAQNILKWIGNGFSNIATWADTNFITPLVKTLGVESAWENLKSVGSTIVAKIKSGFPSFSTWVENNIVSPIRSAINGETSWGAAGASIASSISSGLPSFGSWALKNIVDPIANSIIGEENWNNVKKFFEELPSKISGWIESAKDVLSQLGETIGAAILSGMEKYIAENHPTAATFLGIDTGGTGTQTPTGTGSSISDNTGTTMQYVPSDTGGYWIEVGAKITSTKDEIPVDQKNVENMNAMLRYRKYDTGFDRNLYGLSALLRYRKYDSGFDRNLYGLRAMFRYRNYQDGFDRNLYGLTASLRYRKYQNGFDTTLYGLTSQFRYRTFSSSYDSTIYGMTAQVSSVYLSSNAKAELRASLRGELVMAKGGVFVNGRVQPIQSFASGGFPGGQLFRAREAGPELVGTLKGHTAVMNNDQIVASVSAGVARAISNIEFHMNGAMQAPQSYYIDDTAQFDEEMLYRAFVRALSDSDLGGDTYLDGEVLYRNMARRNRQNTRRTGVNEFA